MNVADKIGEMSEQERALLLSLIDWRRSKSEVVTIFSRVIRYMENGARKVAPLAVYRSEPAKWPEQLKRLMHPFIFGDEDPRAIAEVLRERLIMIKTWPPEWFNDKITLN